MAQYDFIFEVQIIDRNRKQLKAVFKQSRKYLEYFPEMDRREYIGFQRNYFEGIIDKNIFN